MTQDTAIPRLVVTALAGSVLLVAAAFLTIFAASSDWHWPPATSTGTVEVAHVLYSDVNSRPLDPGNRVDAQLIAGLPKRDRRIGPGQLLFGAFIQVSNPRNTAERAARRVELRDLGNHTYRSLRLPASNRFAFRLGKLRGMTTLPRPDAPAAANLAAGGYLVLFRIPRASYEAGPLELVIHPAGGGRAGDLAL